MKWFKSLIKNFNFKLSIKNSLQDAGEKSNIIKSNLKKLNHGKIRKRNFK